MITPAGRTALVTGAGQPDVIDAGAAVLDASEAIDEPDLDFYPEMEAARDQLG